MPGGETRGSLFKWTAMSGAAICDIWIAVIIMARYNPAFEKTYSGIEIPSTYWQLATGYAVVAAFWALLSFAIFNARQKPLMWWVTALSCIIFVAGHVAIIVYMYKGIGAWKSFNEDIKKSSKLNVSSLPEDWTQKIPLFGASIFWLYGFFVAGWATGCCCCRGARDDE